MKVFFSVVLMFSFLLSSAFSVEAKGDDYKYARPDRHSRKCLSCHSGGGLHSVGKSHIVGLDYSLASAKDPTLTVPAKLDKALKLVDGRVSCITCHVPYSKADHSALYEWRNSSEAVSDPMLVVDNRHSGLCRKCHKK